MRYTFINIVAVCIVTLSLSSCNDWLELYPEDEIIEDDYWNSGDDVEMMVAGAYRYMLETAVLQRFVYWGEMRSDNLQSNSPSTEERAVIDEGNILSSNSLCSWNAFYKVVNICNYIIAKAPEVCNVDNNYQQSDLQHDLSEAYFIRSLCYFYLVRAYGGVVPYVTEPSSSDATDYNVGAISEEDMLSHLIEDVQLAKSYATPSWGYQQMNCGRVTQNACRALLADIYLWAGRYAECIAECDEVLSHPITLAGAENYGWMLLPRSIFFTNVFYSGNSSESIFEFNLNSDNSSNRSAFPALYGNAETNPHFRPTTNLISLYDIADIRGMQYIDLNQSRVFKYVGQVAPQADSQTEIGNSSYIYRASSSANNWIVYRLADIYLMKAEALAVSGTTPDDFDQVATLCNLTYVRAHPEGIDSLDHSASTDNVSAENMVMEERRREFAFEGKRWFDLLRQVRRAGGPSDNVINTLVNNKYGGTAPDGISGKLSNIGYWYWPIHKDQMDVNDQLKQNDYYQKQESLD